MTQYNFYYGTIGRTLGCRYRFTKKCNSEKEAIELLNNLVASFYYKNEGKYGIPSYKQIEEESELTGLDLEVLYKDHINDMMRFYIIPTNVDSIPYKKLKY